MTARRLLPALLVAFALFAAGCSVYSEGDTSAYGPPQPPARIGLPPEYRVFFDELKDDGDWTQIEPYGWVFRPRVNFDAWRPYEYGWWEPSDEYGWIWNSTESFGWITYHYGSWFYDPYQGWCWAPGPVWGPAWVAWVQAGDYVGWAPLAPSQYDGYGQVPGGVFTYTSLNALGNHDVGTQSMFVTSLPTTVAVPSAIVNVGRAGGATFNRGPDIAQLRARGVALPEPVDPSTLRRLSVSAPATRGSSPDVQAGTTRLVTEATRETRAFRERGQWPPRAAGSRMPAAPAVPVAPAPAPEQAAPAVQQSPTHFDEHAPAPSPVDHAPAAPAFHAPVRPAPPAAADSARAHPAHAPGGAGKHKPRSGHRGARPRPAPADSTRRG
ncbi:MAG TPA: DUF6600 domain-containing protein [Candidatus Acidoferrales bacterium]|nr:DUF6600 domain-containing protein [Candidatus Acidoferrales bacterium]